MAVRRRAGNAAFHKEHPAFRAFAGFVRNDFRMHGAGVFDPLRQGRRIKFRDVWCKSPIAEQFAQILQSGDQARLRHLRHHVGSGQRAKIGLTKRENAPGSRHLGPDDAGRIGQRSGQGPRDQQDVRVARRHRADQPCGVQIETKRIRDVLSRHHERAQIPRHGPGDQPAETAQQTLTCPGQIHHCRLSAPWLHP